MNILIAETMAHAGLELLQAQRDWNVIVSNPREYEQHLAECDALVVRSAIHLDAETLRRAPKLKLIGRLGVSVDNIDLHAATAAGILVMNTPGGNAVSVAEHTLALMLSMSRSIPQANASTKAGNWERKKFSGSELRGKTVGVVGLGSIGREVVRRTRAFEMRVLAYDPYVTSAIARDLSVELVSLQDLYAQSDYITVHVSLTSETDHLLNEAAFARMKQGVRIVNCARGELIDEAALQSAIESGKVAGAALDVFAHEPTDATHPLFKLEQVLATPHIGGATEEAKEIVGLRLAEQMMEFLQHGTAINAVNMPSLSPDQHRLVRPFVELSERLGRFAAHMLTGNPISIRMTYFGRIADLNTTLLRNAGLAGVLNRSSSAHANAVNAMQIASEHGWTVAETHDKRSGHADSIRVEIETDSAVTTVEGAVVLGKPRLIQIDGIYCEAPLAGPLVCLKNLDVPGVVGHVGSVLGSNRINIANFSLGRRDSGEPLEAISVVSTDTLVPQEVLDQLMSNPAVKLARSVAVG